jgi:hypothetical protein
LERTSAWPLSRALDDYLVDAEDRGTGPTMADVQVPGRL